MSYMVTNYLTPVAVLRILRFLRPNPRLICIMQEEKF